MPSAGIEPGFGMPEAVEHVEAPTGEHGE
jgi:hypothetical protein